MRTRVRLTRPWSSPTAAPLCLLAAFLVAVVPVPLWAGDWYVDDDGDCVNGDGSQGNPFCLIQNAIDAAQDGDTIHIAPGLYHEQLLVDRNLALIGTMGKAFTTVDAAGISSPVTIGLSVEASLKGFTLTNGAASGIRNEGSLTVTNSTMSGNSSDYGGGVFNAGGTLNLTNCTVEANSSTFQGGGISNDLFGTLTLANCTVRSNSAGRDGGGVFGALYGAVSLTDCTVSDNHTTQDGGGISAASLGVLTLTSCTVTDNQADSGGGGIATYADLTLTDCLVADNSARDGGGIESHAVMTMSGTTVRANNGLTAGGIRNTGTAHLVDSEVSGNDSANFGGGIVNFENMTLTRTDIRSNTADESGAGIYHTGEDMVLTDCIVRSNQSQSIRGWGGGINNSGDTLTLIRSTITDNQSRFEDGGGLFNSNVATATLSHCILGNNFAGETGGGIANLGTLMVTDSLLFGNRADQGGGGLSNRGQLAVTRCTVAANRADVSGGGIQGEATIRIGHSVIAANTAPLGPDCDSTLTSEGYNLLGDSSDCTIEGDPTGNLYDLEPRFADPGGLDWSLQAVSPCVDAGDPAVAPAGTDLASNPRVLDGDLDRLMVIDMGAYEYGNVHLEITGDATLGGNLTVETTGRPRLIALLFFSTRTGELMLPPFGSLFMGAPFQFFPFAVIPDTRDITLPADAPIGVEIRIQELAVDLFSGAGNFSNLVKLVIE